jgi:hypothetical protein
MPRTVAEIDTELALWYTARSAAASRMGATSVTVAGRSFSVSIKDINDTITGLERERRAANGQRFTRIRVSGVGEGL